MMTFPLLTPVDAYAVWRDPEDRLWRTPPGFEAPGDGWEKVEGSPCSARHWSLRRWRSA